MQVEWIRLDRELTAADFAEIQRAKNTFSFGRICLWWLLLGVCTRASVRLCVRVSLCASVCLCVRLCACLSVSVCSFVSVQC